MNATAPEESDRAAVARWRTLASDPRVDLVLRGLFEEIAETVRARRPLCLASGNCCHFERHGHRLYVTGLETAWTLARLRETHRRTVSPTDVTDALARGDCPLMDGRFCGAHAVRPFGCRVYFCDPHATAWQNDLYERMHAAVQSLHERVDAPYRYLEWRAALALCASA